MHGNSKWWKYKEKLQFLADNFTVNKLPFNYTVTSFKEEINELIKLSDLDEYSTKYFKNKTGV